MILQSLMGSPVASFVFVLTIAFSLYSFSKPEYYSKFMLHPYSVYRDKTKWYTLLTSGLIHKDFAHLLFNMITFYFFGFSLEKQFVLMSGDVGHLYFAVLYILGLIISDLPTVFQQKDKYNYYSLGASGAISAVLFSYILFRPKDLLYFFFAIPIPAYLFAFGYLGYCIWASKKAQDGVNHDAHFYGAICGIVLTIFFYPNIISYFLGQF